MESTKVEKIVSLHTEKEKLYHIIEWHKNKHFVFGEEVISQSSPVHSRLLEVLETRKKEIERELEGLQ